MLNVYLKVCSSFYSGISVPEIPSSENYDESVQEFIYNDLCVPIVFH